MGLKTKIEPGDVVRLKSGGPLMTVVDESGYARVQCTWFDGGGQKGLRVRTAALVKADDYEDLHPQVLCLGVDQEDAKKAESNLGKLREMASGVFLSWPDANTIESLIPALMRNGHTITMLGPKLEKNPESFLKRLRMRTDDGE